MLRVEVVFGLTQPELTISPLMRFRHIELCTQPQIPLPRTLYSRPKEKVQKDKQRSTKNTHKTKDRVTRTPLKTGGELGCSK
jgi:hypothetical protein